MISKKTQTRIKLLFNKRNAKIAQKLLEEECGNNLPFLEKATLEELERFQFAALKISDGEMSTLKQAIELAKIDWRDLLIDAGFACDVKAHKSWYPKRKFKLGLL